jgi:hypothetical protein
MYPLTATGCLTNLGPSASNCNEYSNEASVVKWLVQLPFTQGRTSKKFGGVLCSGTDFCSICVCKKSKLFSLC